jgi:hypothetical protein
VLSPTPEVLESGEIGAAAVADARTKQLAHGDAAVHQLKLCELHAIVSVWVCGSRE